MCVDDAYEDNDTRGTSTMIDSDTQLGAFICPADPDYYRFAAEEGSLVEIDLLYDPLESLSLQARRPGLGIVGDSNSGGGFERVSFPSTTEGPVTVEVAGAPGVSHVRTYELFVRTLNIGDCAGDDEPNEGAELASQIVSGINVPVTWSSQLCPFDLDTFRFEWGMPAMYVQLIFEGDESLRLRVTDLANETVFGTFVGGEEGYIAPWSDESGVLLWVFGEADQDVDLDYTVTATAYFLE
jgi:hypothetical protein